MVNIEVVSANYLGGHTIALLFSDGTQQVICFMNFLKKFAHPDYDRYLNEEEFKKFQVIDGNINWNDYHMIFTIEALHNGKI